MIVRLDVRFEGSSMASKSNPNNMFFAALGICSIIVLVTFALMDLAGMDRPEYQAKVRYNQCMDVLRESKQVTPEAIAECKTLLPKE